MSRWVRGRSRHRVWHDRLPPEDRRLSAPGFARLEPPKPPPRTSMRREDTPISNAWETFVGVGKRACRGTRRARRLSQASCQSVTKMQSVGFVAEMTGDYSDGRHELHE